MRDCKILEQLMNAMESASLCVRVNSAGQVIWFSDALKQLDSQQTITLGMPLSKLLHADLRSQLLDQFDYTVTQHSHWQGTVKLNLGSRRADWFKAIFVPLYDDNQCLQEQQPQGGPEATLSRGGRKDRQKLTAMCSHPQQQRSPPFALLPTAALGQAQARCGGGRGGRRARAGGSLGVRRDRLVERLLLGGGARLLASIDCFLALDSGESAEVPPVGVGAPGELTLLPRHCANSASSACSRASSARLRLMRAAIELRSRSSASPMRVAIVPRKSVGTAKAEESAMCAVRAWPSSLDVPGVARTSRTRPRGPRLQVGGSASAATRCRARA